jgi:hypothetical protein
MLKSMTLVKLSHIQLPRRSVTTGSTVSGLDAYRPVIQRPWVAVSGWCVLVWELFMAASHVQIGGFFLQQK